MKYVVCILVLVYIIFTAVLLGTDYFLNKFNALKRFHIGRWVSKEQWQNAVEKTALKWLKKTPTVRATDNYKLVLLDMLHGKYRNATIQSWQTASLVLGLNASENHDDILTGWKNSVLTSDGNWKQLDNKVDYAMLAYALLKTSGDKNAVKPAMDAVIKVLEANLCDDGMISYSQGQKSDVRYVDTLGMVCPFLTLYGTVYNEPKYIDMAVNQISLFRDFGLLKDTSLPNHAVNVKNSHPLGIYGWGRGTAWYFLGLLDTYKELEDAEKKSVLKEWLFEAAQCYKYYQQSNGGFCSILQGGGQYDSSVTAAMAYFYKSCAEIFENTDYDEIAEKCFKKLMTVTMQSGAVDVCQGDTHGIGVFSQVYDIMPFAQGLVLRALHIK